MLQVQFNAPSVTAVLSVNMAVRERDVIEAQQPLQNFVSNLQSLSLLTRQCLHNLTFERVWKLILVKNREIARVDRSGCTRTDSILVHALYFQALSMSWVDCIVVKLMLNQSSWISALFWIVRIIGAWFTSRMLWWEQNFRKVPVAESLFWDYCIPK